MRATLGALMLALAAWPLAAHADDYGPRRDVAAIRHDLPILLASRVRRDAKDQNTLGASSFIDGVVVSRQLALVQWHAGSDEAILGMTLRFGRWWIDQDTAWPLPLATSGWGCGMHLSSPHRALVPLADGHLPAITELLHPPTTVPNERSDALCGVPLGKPTWADPIRMEAAPYAATLTLAPADETDGTRVQDLQGRAPTEAESWANQPSGNAYFFFSGTVQSPQPVHVQAGTTLDVWFPFVLDTSLRYSLTIAAPNAMSLGPVEGTLNDNTLHFVLPAFTAPPGAELMGEIDSD
ncbi:MAG: hypothetical protein WA629_00880 [Candidatus Aquilonibacter sp.]